MLPFAIDNFNLRNLYGLVMTSEARNTKLQQLTTYLRSLPTSLDIENFEPQKRWIDIIGTVEGAVNRELECRLGAHANAIEFTERGSPMEAPVKVLDWYMNEFLEDTLLNISLLKVCGRRGDVEIWVCLHRPPTITWIGDIIGCMGVLAWMLRSRNTCAEGEYGGLYMMRCRRCDPRALEYTRAVHLRI